MHFLAKVRRANRADAAKIYKIGTSTSEFAVSKKIKFFTLNELKEFVDRKDCIFLVAKVRKEIAGFVIAFVMTRYWLFVDNFYILPKFRRQEVASELEKVMIKVAKKKKIDYISRIVKPSHASSRKFLKKKGYKETTGFLWLEKFI